jgi:hypothetical protein
MAKFYIESGNYRIIVVNDNYLDAMIDALTHLAKKQMKGKDLHIKLGPSVGLSEIGFFNSLLADNKEDSAEELSFRRKNYISVNSLKEKIDYKMGITLFLPTKQLVNMINFD